MNTKKRSRFHTDQLREAYFCIDLGDGKYPNCACAHLKQLNLIGQVKYQKQYLKIIGIDVRPPNNLRCF